MLNGISIMFSIRINIRTIMGSLIRSVVNRYVAIFSISLLGALCIGSYLLGSFIYTITQLVTHILILEYICAVS